MEALHDLCPGVARELCHAALVSCPDIESAAAYLLAEHAPPDEPAAQAEDDLRASLSPQRRPAWQLGPPATWAVPQTTPATAFASPRHQRKIAQGEVLPASQDYRVGAAASQDFRVRTPTPLPAAPRRPNSPPAQSPAEPVSPLALPSCMTLPSCNPLAAPYAPAAVVGASAGRGGRGGGGGKPAPLGVVGGAVHEAPAQAPAQALAQAPAEVQAPVAAQAQAGAPVTLRADALPFNPFGARKEAPAAAQAQVGTPFVPRADALRFNPFGAVKVMRREYNGA